MNNEAIPLVSVAIITYNQKEYLRECIESVLSQTYANIEIVVADDASTDGTREMLLDYSNAYPVKFNLQLGDINVGITKNSNRAHFSCKGKYIAWMGGDDLMGSKKIEKQVAFMEKNPRCVICYHNLEVFNSETNKTLYYFNEKNKPRSGGFTKSLKYGVFNGACSTMIRRSHAPKNGFDSRLPVASDWLYWLETLEKGGEIEYINQVLGRYRRHKNNVTLYKENNIPQGFLDHLQTCNIMLFKYPRFNSMIFRRYAYALFHARKHVSDYNGIIRASLKIKISLKAFYALLCYYLIRRRF